ncbi:MAG: MOSC domain-containing protein [Gammaproteobacteria bacterium]
MIKISELYIYPVKSLSGIQIQTSELTPFGLKYDRRWMLVDANGRFITQRENADLATIQTQIQDNQLILSYQNLEIQVPDVDEKNAEQIEVTIWKDSFKASLVSHEVDSWLSERLNMSCRLVYMPENTQRQINMDFAEKNQFVSFADGYPILLVSQESLDDLNSRLTHKVNINRFRPNIVVTGTNAYAEDDWSEFSVNELNFRAVKKCSRCIIPSINQTSGVQDRKEIIAVLNQYRKVDKKIYFGQNVICQNVEKISCPSISCGDLINLK